MVDKQSISGEDDASGGFTAFGLSQEILRALSEQGYVTPTPIQVKSIPPALQGRDVMGAAQTGTGKTAGFALPLIQRLLPFSSTSVSPARHPVRALILVPTRELAVQVAENIKSYARHTLLRSAVVFGGVDIAPQANALRSGVDILIATPGRLLDHVQQHTVVLSQAAILVLDEADRMLDMGFLPDLQRIIGLLPEKRQNLMFSATFSPEIRKLAASFLNNPVSVEAARSNATADTVTQVVYQVNKEDKNDAVAHIVRSQQLDRVLIFTNTRVGASRLTHQLEKKGIHATAIHGDRTQQERMIALDAFKKGKIDALVATDVAARGLDIVELPCVINYDLPRVAEDYVHRIGRTGRAGASGMAISFYSNDDEPYLSEIEKVIRRKLSRLPLSGLIGKEQGSADRALPEKKASPRVPPTRSSATPAERKTWTSSSPPRATRSPPAKGGRQVISRTLHRKIPVLLGGKGKK
ncbi:MAG: DEAD/DEAH box helicase [Burkholderiaceae bacterium]|nr:DEAD/DEAH box helicase [Burkholderiaceae bacterium]